MRIVIDAFGGDNAPLEIVKGAALASKEFNVDITLTGNEQEIRKCISDNNIEFSGELKIVHTDDVISMHDEPTTLLKAHSESSMALASSVVTCTALQVRNSLRPLVVVFVSLVSVAQKLIARLSSLCSMQTLYMTSVMA